MALPPSRTQDQFVLRLPDGLRDRIADVAKSNNRSMNSEIVAILEERLVPSLATRLRSLINQLNQAHLEKNIPVPARRRDWRGRRVFCGGGV